MFLLHFLEAPVVPFKTSLHYSRLIGCFLCDSPLFVVINSSFGGESFSCTVRGITEFDESVQTVGCEDIQNDGMLWVLVEYLI